MTEPTTPADAAAEAIDRAHHLKPDPWEPCANVALAAVMPDGRTVAQTLNDGAEWEKWGRAAGAVLRHIVGNPSIAEAISRVPADPDFVALLAKLDAP